MRLWFGKFQGRTLREIPQDYLDWLASVDLHNEKLRAAVGEERERRIFLQEHPGAVNSRLVDEIIQAGVRSLAKKHHPDHGGSDDKMIQINVCADWIKEQAREALTRCE